MSTTDTARASRWAAAVPTSGVFTEEQAQRVQALRVAREVLETRSAAGPFTSGATTTASAGELTFVAEWICLGEVTS